jgi:uncharacterized protein involved in exopolysaccharide biosynthesis
VTDSNDKHGKSFFQANFNELNRTLNPFISQPNKESQIEKSRRILGEVASDLSDDDLQIFLTEIQYLINSWFDHYEKQIFNGQTLRQVLNGG